MVYMIVIEFPYEGLIVKGIYSTSDLAEKQADRLRKTYPEDEICTVRVLTVPLDTEVNIS